MLWTKVSLFSSTNDYRITRGRPGLSYGDDDPVEDIGFVAGSRVNSAIKCDHQGDD